MPMIPDLFVYSGYAAILILAIGLLVVGSAAREVLALRLRTGHIEGIPRDRLPPYVEPLCADTVEHLQTLGFEPFACARQEEMLASPHAVRWAQVYVHREEKAFASVAVASAPDARNACEVELVTFFADDRVAVTMDGKAHTLIPCLDWLSVHDGFTGDLDAQWALHRRCVAAHGGGPPVLVDADAYSAWGNRLLREYPVTLQLGGWVQPAEQTGTFSFCFLPALRFALRMLWQGRRVSAPAGSTPQGPSSTVDAAALAQAQAVAYQRQVDVARHLPGGWLGKTTLFLCSAVLFVLAFGIQMSTHMVLILLGVLLLHELGHVAAMRAFGYRDLQILFVPFLGAAASGTPRQPKAYQQLGVALMGSAPGIVVGYTLLRAAGPELGGLVWQVGLSMLVLNYLNLFPVLPLDGGQVMNLLLFSRYPRMRSLFSLLSAGVLGYAGWAGNEPVLWAPAVLILLGVARQRQIATVVRELTMDRRAGAELHEPEGALLERIFRVIPKTDLAKQAFTNQYRFVHASLQQLRQAHARWPVALAGLTIYAALIVMPPLLLVRDIPALAGLGSPGSLLGEGLPESPDWEAKLATAATAGARWDTLMEAGDWFAETDQFGEAQEYYGRAERVAEDFGPDDPRVAHTLVRISNLGMTDPAEDRSRLERALAIQERALGPDHLDLAATLEELAMIYAALDGTLQEVVIPLHRAVDIRRREQGEQHPDLAEALTTLAHVYDTRGQFEEAESRHRAAAEIYLTALGPSDVRTRLAEQRLADLYLSHGYPGKAVALLETTLRQFPADSPAEDGHARSRIHTTLGWARLFQEDYAAAQERFEAAVRDYGQMPGFPGGDPGRMPLLMDLIWVHASQARWDTARVPFDELVRLMKETVRISPEEFADRLGQWGDTLPAARADWRDRRRQAQARGLRLMLER